MIDKEKTTGQETSNVSEENAKLKKIRRTNKVLL